MIVGILVEIQSEENRVCMTPVGIEVLKQNGHIGHEGIARAS